MSNLILRLITGVIIAVCTLAVTFIGGLAFKIFFFCVGAAVLYEWNNIISPVKSVRGYWCSWLFFALLGGVLCLSPTIMCLLTVLASGACLSYAVSWQQSGKKSAFLHMLGFVYAALLPISLVLLRDGLGQGNEAGIYWVLFLYVTVWCSDIGAYICGRLCGGQKLATKISPNKTWSGAIGGEIFAAAAAVIFVFLLRQMAILEHGGDVMKSFISFYWIIAMAVLLSFIAQIGDLAESFFKRRFKVKDSGHLLPGHGGIMDRIDGLLPAAAVFLCFLLFVPWKFP